MDERTASSGDQAPEQLRLQSVVAGLLDPVVTIDRFGTILFASDSVERVFGYLPLELVGENIKVLMPEPHRSKHDDYLASYRATGETWILGTIREFEVVRKNGERFWTELSVARVDVPGEEHPVFAGTFRDISARKEIERSLQASEARFRAIFDQEYQLVGLLDAEGTVVEMNQAALQSLGREREEVVGRRFWESCWWGGDPELSARCRGWVEAARRGEFVREEVKLSNADGTPRFIDFSLKPIFDDQGAVTLLLPEGRDTTEIHAAQDREKAVLGALAAVGEQASILAHEIKNPITSIHLALRAVAAKLGEDERGTLEGLVERMRSLELRIRRTLTFARPIELDRAATDVLPLVLDAIEPLREDATRQGIELVVEVSPDLPRVDVDGARIVDVLTILVRNAFDATCEGGRVHVRAAPAGNHIEVSVEDDGPGLEDGLREQVFKPFVTTKEKGTGLGLSLARNIAEAHGGTLHATRSEELDGARFVLALPIDPAPTL